MFPSIYKPERPSAFLDDNSPLVITSPIFSDTSSEHSIILRNNKSMPFTESELEELCDGAIEQSNSVTEQVRPFSVPRLNIDMMMQRRKEAEKRRKEAKKKEKEMNAKKEKEQSKSKKDS